DQLRWAEPPRVRGHALSVRDHPQGPATGRQTCIARVAERRDLARCGVEPLDRAAIAGAHPQRTLPDEELVVGHAPSIEWRAMIERDLPDDRIASRVDLEHDAIRVNPIAARRDDHASDPDAAVEERDRAAARPIRQRDLIGDSIRRFGDPIDTRVPDAWVTYNPYGTVGEREVRGIHIDPVDDLARSGIHSNYSRRVIGTRAALVDHPKR